MTRSAILERLRPGRDPNDTSWVLARYLSDWTGALASQGVTWNAGAEALELAPIARPDLGLSWLPNTAVTRADGTAFRIDSETGQLLAKRHCDKTFQPIRGLGGTGVATGHFNAPTSVSLDRRGNLYITDAGNGRVQVIDPDAPTVIAVLDHELQRPVHLALADDGTVYVLDAATRRVHVFWPGYRPGPSYALSTLDPMTGDALAAPEKSRPRGIWLRADNGLAIFDPALPYLWHMHCDGAPRPALGWPVGTDLPPGWSPIPRQYTAGGEVILGPIDSGLPGLPWHRIVIDAETPEGTSLTAQSFASDSADADQPLAWAPRAPVVMPTRPADRDGAELDRLVLGNSDLWPLWANGRMRRAETELHQFGDGEDAVVGGTLNLPYAVARHVMPGDVLRLTRPDGSSDDVTVVAIPSQSLKLEVDGKALSVAQAGVAHLVARDEPGALPFGPLELGFLNYGPMSFPPETKRDGTEVTAQLPHALACFLKPGDVVDFTGDDGRTRVSIVTSPAPDDVVGLTIDAAPTEPYTGAQVTRIATASRLAVREPLPDIVTVAPGSQIAVISDAFSIMAEIAAIDADCGAIWLAANALPDPAPGADPMPKVTKLNWTNAEVAEPSRSDRGRYLWVRLQLTGRPHRPPGHSGPADVASSTPSVRMLRVLGPRPDHLALLPSVYSRRDPLEEPPEAQFLERFLSLFEGQYTRIEEAFDSVSRLLNPEAADETWLDFVASWTDLAFDPSWPIERRRTLILEGAALQAGAGTSAAMRRYLEIYTGAPVAITEGFRARPPEPIRLGARGALGVAPLGGCNESGQADSFAHRFTVGVTVPDFGDRDASVAAIRRIIEATKPAHTSYRLDTGEGRQNRIGMDLAIGTGIVFGPETGDPCACDPDEPAGPRPKTGHVAGGFRLGGRLGQGPVSEFAPQGE